MQGQTLRSTKRGRPCMVMQRQHFAGAGIFQAQQAAAGEVEIIGLVRRGQRQPGMARQVEIRKNDVLVLKAAPISDDGEFLLDEFKRLLTPKTKMVAKSTSCR